MQYGGRYRVGTSISGGIPLLDDVVIEQVDTVPVTVAVGFTVTVEIDMGRVTGCGFGSGSCAIGGIITVYGTVGGMLHGSPSLHSVGFGSILGHWADVDPRGPT